MKTTKKMKTTPEMKATTRRKTTPKLKTTPKTKRNDKMKMNPKMKMNQKINITSKNEDNSSLLALLKLPIKRLSQKAIIYGHLCNFIRQRTTTQNWGRILPGGDCCYHIYNVGDKELPSHNCPQLPSTLLAGW